MSSPLLEVKDLQVIVGEENKVLLDGLNLTVNMRRDPCPDGSQRCLEQSPP